MKLINCQFEHTSRKIQYKLFVLGDTHVGAPNCAEGALRKLVADIKKDPNAYWLGGGDYCDAVILNDSKRFDVNAIPDWMLAGNSKTIKDRIGDMLYAQRERFCDIVDPIKDRCLGLIEGNHEYSIFKYHNRDHMAQICRTLGTETLTDCAFVRMQFIRKSVKGGRHTSTCTVFICHGHGGGRRPGSEPNRLFYLAADKDCNIVLSGHSHAFHILPPITMLGVPNKGILPTECIPREKYVGNWGSYLYTYKAGPANYASRVNYPVRPMYTFEIRLSPHISQRRGKACHEKFGIEMVPYKLG